MNSIGWHEVPKEASLRTVLFSGIFFSMALYLLFASSIVAMFSVDVDIVRNVLDLPKHGFKLYALNITEASADVLNVRPSLHDPVRLLWHKLHLSLTTQFVLGKIQPKSSRSLHLRRDPTVCAFFAVRR